MLTNTSLVIWMLIFVAVAAANLPFLTERLFGLIPLSSKPVWIRLFELSVLYLIVGAIAHFLESAVGQVFSQGWAFYVMTGGIFLVFAYPGWVICYLAKRRD